MTNLLYSCYSLAFAELTMFKGRILFTFHVLFMSFLIRGGTLCSFIDDPEDRKVHIVYLGPVPQGEFSPSPHHFSILQKVVNQSFLSNSLIRSYKRSFNGFAANLTFEEGQKMSSMEEVVSVFPSTFLKLHTTRSWDFMGFHQTVRRKTTGESDVIVGVIDTGIWPESDSFNDEGLGQIPNKWKGSCEGGRNFTCNRKIIGARYYSSGKSRHLSARDDMGHGSHTASIAAGNYVKDVSFFGLGQGVARGGAPSARIAAYKVCYEDSGCDSADILAAFDDAIADGVDIITISIGTEKPVRMDRDVISIGAFHGLEKGILTVQSAGNGVCEAESVTSIAPWVLTIAASSTDRKFVDKVVLGNGKEVIGSSINSFTLNGTMFPLAYGKDVSRQCSDFDSRSCKKGCLDTDLVNGKIVLCDEFEGTIEAYQAGALGAIVLNTQLDDVSYIVPLPALALKSHGYSLVKDYLSSTKNPQVKILKSEADKDLTAPVVASFSTCGPNAIIPEILKPDVTAPGIDILAAYSPIASPSDGPVDVDRRKVKYSIESGTSMACPHVAGVAAYVKSFHPDWSPSAVKSAIMTTACPMNNSLNVQGDLSFGSGHINPVRAIAPGLVYEANTGDYIKLLCQLGFDSTSLRRISGDQSTCLGGFDRTLPVDFNYPAIAFRVSPKESFSFKFHRTVTNVGFSNSTYTARVISDDRVSVKVVPRVLTFKSLHERKSFAVIVKGKNWSVSKMASTSLVWSDGIHSVRTPIVGVTHH